MLVTFYQWSEDTPACYMSHKVWCKYSDSLSALLGLFRLAWILQRLALSGVTYVKKCQLSAKFPVVMCSMWHWVLSSRVIVTSLSSDSSCRACRRDDCGRSPDVFLLMLAYWLFCVSGIVYEGYSHIYICLDVCTFPCFCDWGPPWKWDGLSIIIIIVIIIIIINYYYQGGSGSVSRDLAWGLEGGRFKSSYRPQYGSSWRDASPLPRLLPRCSRARHWTCHVCSPGTDIAAHLCVYVYVCVYLECAASDGLNS